MDDDSIVLESLPSSMSDYDSISSIPLQEGYVNPEGAQGVDGAPSESIERCTPLQQPAGPLQLGVAAEAAVAFNEAKAPSCDSACFSPIDSSELLQSSTALVRTLQKHRAPVAMFPKVRLSVLEPQARHSLFAVSCHMYLTATEIYFQLVEKDTSSSATRPPCDGSSPRSRRVQQGISISTSTSCVTRRLLGGLLFVNGLACIPRCSIREVAPFACRATPSATRTASSSSSSSSRNAIPAGFAIKTRSFQQVFIDVSLTQDGVAILQRQLWNTIGTSSHEYPAGGGGLRGPSSLPPLSELEEKASPLVQIVGTTPEKASPPIIPGVLKSAPPVPPLVAASRARTAGEWAIAALCADLLTPVGGCLWRAGLFDAFGGAVAMQHARWAARALERISVELHATTENGSRSAPRWMCKLPVEFERQGVTKMWRCSHVNADFAACPTYPPLWWVPSSVPDSTVRNAANTRTKSRGQALTYFHKHSGGAIVRCSQPVRGEDFVSRVYTTAGSEMMLALRRTTVSHSLVVFDLRPYKNAAANVLTGGSYHSSTDGMLVRFCDIENIHQVRAAFEAVFELAFPGTAAVRSSQDAAATSHTEKVTYSAAALGAHGPAAVTSTPTEFLAAVNRTKWLDYTFSLLTAAVDVARVVAGVSAAPVRGAASAGARGLPRVFSTTSASSPLSQTQAPFPSSSASGSGVALTVTSAAARVAVVHCSDGWDRTSQVCALAQVMLDPYFRTVRGLVALIEKDFVMFGHNFLKRSDVFALGDLQETCPIFMQFLDAVFHLLIAYPSAFEFTEAFLLFLITVVNGGFCGSFFHDSLKDLLAVEEHAPTLTLAQIVVCVMDDKEVEDGALPQNPWLNPSFTGSSVALLHPLPPSAVTLWANLLFRHSQSTAALPKPVPLPQPAQSPIDGDASVHSQLVSRPTLVVACIPVVGKSPEGFGQGDQGHTTPSAERFVEVNHEEAAHSDNSGAENQNHVTPVNSHAASFPSTPMQHQTLARIGGFHTSTLPGVLSADELGQFTASHHHTPSTPARAPTTGSQRQHGSSSGSSPNRQPTFGAELPLCAQSTQRLPTQLAGLDDD